MRGRQRLAVLLHLVGAEQLRAQRRLFIGVVGHPAAAPEQRQHLQQATGNAIAADFQSSSLVVEPTVRCTGNCLRAPRSALCGDAHTVCVARALDTTVCVRELTNARSADSLPAGRRSCPGVRMKVPASKLAHVSFWLATLVMVVMGWTLYGAATSERESRSEER